MTTPDDSLGSVRRPQRDKRVTDPQRYLFQRLREADAMIAFWSKSTKPYAGDDLHWRRRMRMTILQQIAEMEREYGKD